MYQRIQQPSAWQPPTQAKRSQFAPRPFGQEAPAESAFAPRSFGQDAPPLSQFAPRSFGPHLSGAARSERASLLQRALQARSGASMAMPPIQAKLTIGQPNDKYEQEADQVASQVVQQINAPAIAPQITQLQSANTPSENRTGMPDSLKTGLEQLSGLDMSGVRVHYNSAKPAQLGALAYTQGTDIHVAPGQERYLPHEGWHVVQQMQGRVRPTMQMKGVGINDDTGLEREADVMGAKAATQKISNRSPALQGQPVTNEGGLKARSVNQFTSLPELVGLREGISHDFRSLGSGGAPSVPLIQPKVGFEFESNMFSWKFWKNRTPRQDDINDIPIGYYWYGWKPLKKGTKLVIGENFTAEADEAPEGKSDVEFVTKAFEENDSGRTALSNTMDQIEEFATVAYNKREAWKTMVPVSEIEVGTVALKNGAVQVTKEISASPQVTAGIILSRVRKLFELTGTARQQLMGMNNGVGADVGTRALDGANREVDNLAEEEEMFNSKRLRSLVSLLASYLIYGNDKDGSEPGNSITYAKNIATVMGRTDFATMFKMLPLEVQQRFRTTPADFVRLVLAASNLSGTEAIPVIPSGLTYPEAKNERILDRITRDAWLTGIVNGKDILTKKKAPKGKSEMESLGALGSKTETVGPHDEAAPIFELRRMGTSVPLAEWKPLALRVFDYMVKLNDLDNTPSYGEEGDVAYQ